MNTYFVEGIFTPKRSRRAGDVEPFAKSFWASSPDEAVRLATDELAGGQWIEAPKVSRTSEEQRMRAMGAPELPGFGYPPKEKASKRRKK